MRSERSAIIRNHSELLQGFIILAGLDMIDLIKVVTEIVSTLIISSLASVLKDMWPLISATNFIGSGLNRKALL